MKDIISSIEQTLTGATESGMNRLESIAGGITAVLIVSLVIGLVVCFLGLKLMLVFVTLIGFVTGAVIGVVAGLRFGVTGIMLGIMVLIAATIVGILFCKFYKVGVFLWMFCLGAGTAVLLMQPDTIWAISVCVIIGLVLAVLAVIFVEPLVIFVTSINGGMSAGTAVAALLGMSANPVIGLVAGVVLAILGIITQFAVNSRDVGKQEKDFSKEIRDKVSRETEVERARKMLEPSDKTK